MVLFIALIIVVHRYEPTCPQGRVEGKTQASTKATLSHPHIRCPDGTRAIAGFLSFPRPLVPLGSRAQQSPLSTINRKTCGALALCRCSTLESHFPPLQSAKENPLHTHGLPLRHESSSRLSFLETFLLRSIRLSRHQLNS
ncbi:Hypothetical predicted protein [Cloeon dipterum]|uniref:Uncharacterized protein n=1 Tax=Cloeon dipterum TaxID=197152 RepID=A0A8S1DID3_9INSE|nr:Hypothetical predicted protein [Cloeon dipterum]